MRQLRACWKHKPDVASEICQKERSVAYPAAPLIEGGTGRVSGGGSSRVRKPNEHTVFAKVL